MRRIAPVVLGLVTLSEPPFALAQLALQVVGVVLGRLAWPRRGVARA